MIALLFVVVTAKETNIEIGSKPAKMRFAGLVPVRVFLDRRECVAGLRRDDRQCVTLAA
jgi:hypothetical protein